MLARTFLDALDRMAASLAEHAEMQAELARRWSEASAWADGGPRQSVIPPDMNSAADGVAGEFKKLFGSECDIAVVRELMTEARGLVLLTWCGAQMQNCNVQMATVLAVAANNPDWHDLVPTLARERVIKGPLLDALRCAPLIGDGGQLSLPVNVEARARLEILIWEAGAGALALPFLGQWIWGSSSTFEAMVHEPARGALRGRVLAARCLEVSVCGMPAHADPDLVGRTLQVLQPLLLHPEPLVWVHAARALGRLTGNLEQLEGTLLDWVQGESPVLRQRAMTAFASLPAERLNFLASQLKAIIDTPDINSPALAAVAAATPYLYFERRKLWDRLAVRILAGDGGALAARALARGLSTLWRRGDHRVEIESPLHRLREMARRAHAVSLDEAQRTIYLMFNRGPFAGYKFAGCSSFVGFEERVHAARIASGLTRPTTERSKFSELLHLRVRREGGVGSTACQELLLCDLWGEDFREARDSVDGCRNMGILKRADAFVLLVDGAKTCRLDNRQQAKADTIALLRNILDCGMLTETSEIDVVHTKWDKIESSSDPKAAKEFVEHIDNETKRHFASRLAKITFSKVAAQPTDDTLPMGYGLSELFPRWVERPVGAARHHTVKIPEPVDACEYDRYLNRWLRLNAANGTP